MSQSSTSQNQSPQADPQPAGQTRQSIVGRVFSRPAIAGTRALSLCLAAALTVLPLGLLLAQNRGRIADPTPVLIIGAVAASLAVAATAVLQVRLAPHVAAALGGSAGYIFFSMSWVGTGSTPTYLIVWFGASVLLSAVILVLIGQSKATMLAISGIVSVAAIATTALGIAPTSTPATTPTALAFTGEVTTTPNIYVLVLDGFARPDILASQLGDVDVELDPAITALESLGFVLEPQATSNYAETLVSVPSTLNATLHVTPETPLTLEERWAYAQTALRGDNATVSFLADSGYEYWHSGSGLWDNAACDASIADRCLGEGVSSFEAESAVWSITPLRNVLGQPNPDSVQDPVKLIDQILEARTNGAAEPYFVFSHMMTPHHPYRFDRDCTPIDDPSSSITDGAEAHHRALYADQVTCLGKQLEASMERLIEADPSAIVLLQSDHGSAFNVDFNQRTWPPEALDERMSIFRMTRFPEDCRSNDPRAQSVVNTLPLIHGCLTGTEPSLVDDQMFTTNYYPLVEEIDR